MWIFTNRIITILVKNKNIKLTCPEAYSPPLGLVYSCFEHAGLYSSNGTIILAAIETEQSSSSPHVLEAQRVGQLWGRISLSGVISKFLFGLEIIYLVIMGCRLEAV